MAQGPRDGDRTADWFNFEWTVGSSGELKSPWGHCRTGWFGNLRDDGGTVRDRP